MFDTTPLLPTTNPLPEPPPAPKVGAGEALPASHRPPPWTVIVFPSEPAPAPKVTVPLVNNLPLVSTSTELECDVPCTPAVNCAITVIEPEFETTTEQNVALAALPIVKRLPFVQDEPDPVITSLEGTARALLAMIVACATTVPLVRLN